MFSLLGLSTSPVQAVGTFFASVEYAGNDIARLGCLMLTHVRTVLFAVAFFCFLVFSGGGLVYQTRRGIVFVLLEPEEEGWSSAATAFGDGEDVPFLVVRMGVEVKL